VRLYSGASEWQSEAGMVRARHSMHGIHAKIVACARSLYRTRKKQVGMLGADGGKEAARGVQRYLSPGEFHVPLRSTTRRVRAAAMVAASCEYGCAFRGKAAAAVPPAWRKVE